MIQSFRIFYSDKQHLSRASCKGPSQNYCPKPLSQDTAGPESGTFCTQSLSSVTKFLLLLQRLPKGITMKTLIKDHCWQLLGLPPFVMMMEWTVAEEANRSSWPWLMFTKLFSSCPGVQSFSCGSRSGQNEAIAVSKHKRNSE